jgi:hypothetical protein
MSITLKQVTKRSKNAEFMVFVASFFPDFVPKLLDLRFPHFETKLGKHHLCVLDWHNGLVQIGLYAGNSQISIKYALHQLPIVMPDWLSVLELFDRVDRTFVGGWTGRGRYGDPRSREVTFKVIKSGLEMVIWVHDLDGLRSSKFGPTESDRIILDIASRGLQVRHGVVLPNAG